MKTVLIVHPQFDVFGGAEVVAAELIRWLTRQRGVRPRLLTLWPPDRHRVKQMYGATDWLDEVEVTTVGSPAMFRHLPALVRMSALHRAARAQAHKFDVPVSTYNEVNFGKQGFQYIHHPWMASKRLLRQHKVLVSPQPDWLREQSEELYRRSVLRWAHATPAGMQRNLSATNSHFMRAILQDLYDVSPSVIYPPVNARMKEDVVGKWHERPLKCITVGRLTPEKNLMSALRSFELLHQQDPKARMAVAGASVDREYERTLREQARTTGHNVSIHASPSRQDLDKLFSQSQFYLHTKENEHFGITVVEAIRHGCIPLVHDSGGTREVVPDPDLRYTRIEEIPRRLSAIENSPSIDAIRNRLQTNADQFTISSFHRRLEDTLGTLI